MRASLEQAIRIGEVHDADPTFASSIWVGVIGGAALATDADPNVLAPAAGRILRMTAKKGARTRNSLAVIHVIAGVVPASSITLQTWGLDDTQGRWIPIGIAFTLTPTGAVTNRGVATATSPLNASGAKVFVQITANTLVQAIGYDLG